MLETENKIKVSNNVFTPFIIVCRFKFSKRMFEIKNKIKTFHGVFTPFLVVCR
jgi:hypothetical protein